MAKEKRLSGPIPSQTLRNRAEEMAQISPTDVSRMSSNEIQFLIHQLQIHQIELELQNEELRKAQVELAHSRDQYSDLYEFAPTGYVTLDSDGKIQNANLTSAAMLGVERQHLLQANLSDFVIYESQDDFYLHQQTVLSSETKQICEVGIKRAGRSELVIRLESIAFGPENDRRCHTALIDLTTERQAQRQILESERRYRRLTDALADCNYRVRVEHGRPVEIIHGANCEAMTGYTPQEFAANRNLRMMMVPQKDRAAIEQQTACILSGQEAPAVEHRIRRKDGQIIWVLNAVSPERDNHGHLVAYDGLLRDITTRKGAEETLRLINIDLGKTLADRTGELQHNIQRVKLLTEAVSHLGEGVLITSDELEWPGPRIVFVNEAMCRITGYKAEELVGQSPRVLQGNDPNRETLDRIKKELSANRSVLAEVINHRKDGTSYNAELFITPLFNADGRLTNFVSIHRDITERKQAQEALRREHELSEVIIESSQHIILLLDTEGRILRFNQYMENLTGYRLDEVHTRDWFETFLPERDRKRIRALFKQAVSGERTRGNVNAIVTKDGREIEIEWYDAPLTCAEGKLIGVLCTGQDITERKRAQEALRDREERLRAILNTAADAIITIDHRGIITDVNAATERMFGYAYQELLGQNVNMLVPAPFREEHDEYLERYLETGIAQIIGIGREVIGQRKDGSTFPAALSVSEIAHLCLFTGIIRDISEQRKLQRDVVAIAEDEQRRIGQDLHDSTQQELAGLGMLAQTLLSNLSHEFREQPKASAANEKCCDLATKILEGLTRAHHELQSISRGLVPIRLDPRGLMDALRELAARTDDLHGITCAFKCEQPAEVAESFTATHLYRIAQEAITNALKHARAEHILIALESESGQPILQVADDGAGFNLSDKSDGMGLKTMQYRASLIGANLTISPIDTGGTLVTCKVFGGVGELR